MTIAFADIPLITRITTFLSLFASWVLIAEFIIDRHGLDRYLPFYRVGNLCPYDAVVLAVLVIIWLRLHRR